MSTATNGSGNTSSSRGSRVAARAIVGVLALAALAAGAVVGTALLRDGSDPSTAGQSQIPSPPPVRETPDVQGDPQPIRALPADCTSIYSPEMLDYLNASGLPMNDASVDGVVGTNDEALAEIIRSNQNLHCAWGGAGEFGLNTNVTLIDDATRESVLATLRELQFNCTENELDVECTINQSWGQASAGENHILSDDTWVATHWVNFGPQGYTRDIANTLLGG